MRKRAILGIVLNILMTGSAYACGNFQAIVNAEIFPDGGSIDLTLKSDCQSVQIVKYVNPLRGQADLQVNGVSFLPGSNGETLLIQRLDRFIKISSGKDSIDFFKNAEMNRFVNGDQDTFTPIFGLMEVLCVNGKTKAINFGVCKRYLPVN